MQRVMHFGLEILVQVIASGNKHNKVSDDHDHLEDVPHFTLKNKNQFYFSQSKTKINSELDLNGRGISCFNGDSHLLYWSDYHNEVWFRLHL